jgi:hypothetical protein
VAWIAKADEYVFASRMSTLLDGVLSLRQNMSKPPRASVTFPLELWIIEIALA